MPVPAPTIPIHLVNEIRYRYITDKLCTIKLLAAEYDIPEYKVSSLLKGPMYERFREQLQRVLASNAQDTLHRYAEQAAQLWGQSMTVAATKGDHRPMKDLLSAVKAIDLDSHVPNLSISIGGLSLTDITVNLTTPANVPADQPLTGLEPSTLDAEIIGINVPDTDTEPVHVPLEPDPAD